MKSMLIGVLVLLVMNVNGQKVGAYYFDGWSGTTFHITEDLKNKYPEREPKWGWVTSTQQIVDEQVKLAAEVGLSFFSFCWYYKAGQNPDTLVLNRALQFYKKSPQRKKLRFCLLVANHAGFEVGPEDWESLMPIFTKELAHPAHLKANGKPVLIFFEHTSLVKRFGSTESVKLAFTSLRDYAKTHGLPGGINIAVCEGSPDGVQIAEACGADIITGYNYHSAGFSGTETAIPIDKMQQAETRLWDKLTENMHLNYIPVSTVGWDPRPWSNATNKYAEKPYFTGFSALSVQQSVTGILKWVKSNPKKSTSEKIALLYAWNENGEGSWLVPGKNGSDPSEGVKKALKR